MAHLDNDPGDPRHSEGEPGLRASDRAVTAILYLNPDWEESHGGACGCIWRGPGGDGRRGAQRGADGAVRLQEDRARGRAVARVEVGDDGVDKRLTKAVPF